MIYARHKRSISLIFATITLNNHNPMKNALTLAVLVAAFLVACPARAQVSFGDASKFNDGWLFRLTDDSTIVNPTFDDTQWRKLTLPHDWSIEGTIVALTGQLYRLPTGWNRLVSQAFQHHRQCRASLHLFRRSIQPQ